jgi:hypothetical protein
VLHRVIPPFLCPYFRPHFPTERFWFLLYFHIGHSYCRIVKLQSSAVESVVFLFT